MFFPLSKILGFFALPSNLVTVVGLIGVLLLLTRFKRTGRALMVTSLVLLAIIGLTPLGNALILPLVKVLTLPINVMTLGLFSLVINVLVFWLVSLFVPGFTVSGIFDAIIGALLIAVVSWLTNIFIKK